MPPRLKFLNILTLRHYINSFRGDRKNPPTIAEVNPLHLTNIKEGAEGTFLCKIYFHKSLSKVLKIVLTFTFCVDSDRNNGLAFRVFRCFGVFLGIQMPTIMFRLTSPSVDYGCTCRLASLPLRNRDSSR